ncbi:helix-turn-helix transcriptional regulator [Trueperella pyogenes]|uniref:helix-turn-helix domain-containing protein n=1 Tax=Trueperella pyogenes TaxID=1661 RepID=UPI00345D68CB
MTNQPERSISYKPLWKLLIDKNLKRQDLREMSGLSGATIAKLGRNENVTTGVLVRICEALGCQLHEVAEVIVSVKGDDDAKAH